MSQISKSFLKVKKHLNFSNSISIAGKQKPHPFLHIGDYFVPYRDLGKILFKKILYNVVYRDLLLDDSLSKFQRKLIRRLLELLAYRSNYKGYAFPTQKHLSKQLVASLPLIKLALKYLVEKKYVRKEPNKWSFKYYILWHKTYEQFIRKNINSTDGFSAGLIDWQDNYDRINCNKGKIHTEKKSLTIHNYNNERTTSSSLNSYDEFLRKPMISIVG